jgi:hypothetical protein
VNLLLASANRSSADADALLYSCTPTTSGPLSEQIDIALLTMPSEMQYSEHAKKANTSDLKTVA